MKFMHLSDLHLGKRVNEFSMIEDQKYILEQILSLLDREAADAVLMAGDIYDKPVPPAEAVQLFDRFLTELADREIPIFAVSGNHDSAERLSFGSRIMSGQNVFISPVYDGSTARFTLTDDWGEVCVHLLPFIRPSAVRRAFEKEEIHTYQDAVQTAVEQIRPDTEVRNLLVAHQFVTGASRCESEEITVGGIDNVDAAVFDSFDYVALGHIHSPQHIGRKEVRYCGTPLKYSFSEADQEKSVTVAELREKGNVSVTVYPLRPLRDMRKIRGTYLEVTARSFYQNMNTEDYLHITLTDEDDIPDAMQKLRVIYPNVMRLEYDNRRTREEQDIKITEETVQKSDLELFEEFYELQNNQPMTDEQRAFVNEQFRKLRGMDL